MADEETSDDVPGGVLYEPPVPIEPAPVEALATLGGGMTLTTYFGFKNVKAGHKPGRLAYAVTKTGCDPRRTEKTVEEWDELFESY